MSPASISAAEIGKALSSAGLKTGDLALVHSDAMVAGQLPAMPDEQRLDAVIGAIEDVLGAKGTLVMPVFSYSFTQGEVFDVRQTPSKVGMLTERFRTRPGVCRSRDPIFSVAAKGALADELCSRAVRECFGAQSVFAELHRRNGMILCLGCSLSSGGTFVHYVEKFHGVNYRYDKTFSGTTVLADGRSEASSVVYYVRDLARNSAANLRRLQSRLEERGLLRCATLGRSRVLGIRAGDFFQTACTMLDEDPVSLIEEGAEF